MIKTNNRLQAAAILGSLSLVATSMAGTMPAMSAKGSVPPPPPAAAGGLFDNVGATVDLGYDSAYIFRGAKITEQNVWGQIALSVPLAENLSLGFTTWYTSSADVSYDELDLTGGLSYDAGFATLGLGYTWYKFFDGSAGDGFGIDDASEIGATISKGLGPVNVAAGYYYDFEADGSYIELGLDAPIAVNDNISIVPAALVSYGSDYYTNDSGFQHLKLQLSIPIKLTATATLTPYIAGNIPLDLYDSAYDDEVYGGVKLSVSF